MARSLRQGATLRNTDTEYDSASVTRWWSDQSENNVLLAILLAFWRWLLPAPAMQAPAAAFPSPTAAANFAAPPVRGLAPIPVPWRRLLS